MEGGWDGERAREEEEALLLLPASWSRWRAGLDGAVFRKAWAAINAQARPRHSGTTEEQSTGSAGKAAFAMSADVESATAATEVAASVDPCLAALSHVLMPVLRESGLLVADGEGAGGGSLVKGKGNARAADVGARAGKRKRASALGG